MRHRKRIHHLSRPADQRKALIRSLVTAFFIHGKIKTTHKRAKAAQPVIEKVITLAKRGDLHAIRQIVKIIYNQATGGIRMEEDGRLLQNTVLRTILRDIVPRVQTRTSGYTRVIGMPSRRGDAAPMAIIELILDHSDKALASPMHHVHDESCQHDHTSVIETVKEKAQLVESNIIDITGNDVALAESENIPEEEPTHTSVIKESDDIDGAVSSL